MSVTKKTLSVIEGLTDKQFNAVMQVVQEDDTTVSHSEDVSQEEVDETLETLSEEQIAAVKTVLADPKALQKLVSDLESEEEEETETEEETDEEQEESDDNEEAADDAGSEGQAAPAGDGGSVSHSEKEDNKMARKNIFESQNGSNGTETIMHSDEEIKAIFADARDSTKSLHDSVIEHGIKEIETLFPEATNVSPDGLEVLHDPLTAVDQILGGVTKFPKGKIRVRFADLGSTQKEVVESLRAKGYIKGNFKKEQMFKLLSRTTGPTTIYKKQGIDRDDLLDLEDFNVVAFYWKEMRMMLNEEIVRALLTGDGRPATTADGAPNPDHVDSTLFKPIITDDDFYVIKQQYTKIEDFIDHVIRVRKQMLGSGNRSLYVAPGLLDDLTLIKDSTGRYMYDEDAIRKLLRVTNIVETSLLPEGSAVLGNLKDYTISAPKGGDLFTADDFDIDYNKYKYLIETRLGGMVTRPKSFAYFTLAGSRPKVPASLAPAEVEEPKPAGTSTPAGA